jgi:diguanylate cyclase (GGDEF)-like protein
MEVASFSIFINSEGKISQVLADETSLHFIKRKLPFSQLFGIKNQAAIEEFLSAIQAGQQPDGIRIQTNLQNIERQVVLSGSLVGEHSLLLGMMTSETVSDAYFADLMEINNEQMNTLRVVIKELVKTKQQSIDQSALYELTEVNNELMELQRRVSQQNAALDRHLKQIGFLNQMSTELQYSDSLEQTFEIVTQYARDLYPNSGGVMYLYRSDIELFEQRSQWGERETCASTLGEINQGALIEELKRLEEIQEIQEKIEGALSQECLFLAIPGQDWIVGLLQIYPYHSLNPRDAFRVQYQEAFLQSVGLAISNMQMREWLRYDAIMDPLTGLYNRRFLDQQLEREVSRAVRQRSLVSVVMIDLDHFKQVNDLHGHQIGDRLLADFGRLLLNSIRKEDYAARFGGDEFTLILPDATDEETQHVIRRIEDGILGITNESPQVRFGFSYGIAAFPDHGEDAKQVLKMADHFLYAMKRKKH